MLWGVMWGATLWGGQEMPFWFPLSGLWRGDLAAAEERFIIFECSLRLHNIYFPVYSTEGDYNNFTSAHSWAVLTLSMCDEFCINRLSLLI